MTFQSSIKSESSNRDQFSQSVNIRFLQYSQRESSTIISTLRVQSSLNRFYRYSDKFLLDAEFSDFRKWRGIAFQILSETKIKESTRSTVWTTDFPSDKYYLKDYNEDSTDHIRSTGLNQSSSKFHSGQLQGYFSNTILFTISCCLLTLLFYRQ